MIFNKGVIIKSAKKLKALFLDLIFPIECARCGKDGVWLCAGCFSKIESMENQYCLSCKKESARGRFCRACRGDYSLRGVLIAGNYEDELLSKLVKSLKYKFISKLSKDIGRFLILFLGGILKIPANNPPTPIAKGGSVNTPLQKGGEGRFSVSLFSPLAKGRRKDLNFKKALIIPIPLHPRRERWRGFNQAELIAREIADYLHLEMSVGELIRVKHRKPQTKLNKKDRKNNIKNCFFWRGSGLSGRDIVLVDDVATTGATLNEAARILKENGAGRVWGLVAANG